MRYPNYVWMVHNWYNSDWWMLNNSGCKRDEVLNMLKMQLVIDHYPRINEADKNRTNIGGIVSKSVAINIRTYVHIFEIRYLQVSEMHN